MILVDNGQETWYFYHTDGLGSVVALSQWNSSTSQGEIVERYAYDAFGQTKILDSGFSVLSSSAYGNPVMFTGRRYDAESSLYDYRARIYSPALGRFLQPDPIGYYDSMDFYAYVNNNPLNWIDPWGLCKSGPLGTWENPIKIHTKDFMRNSYWMRHPHVDGNPSLYELLRRGKLYHNQTTFLYYGGFWDSMFFNQSSF